MINEKKVVKFAKRRKANDNPYKLGFDKNTEQYTVEFKDSFGKIQIVSITEEIYLSFDRFELDDIKFLNQYDRHIEHSQQTEIQLHFRTKNIRDDDFVVLERKLDYEKINKLSSHLTKIQRRRLEMYYFEELNYEQIAEIEHCSMQVVARSISSAKEKLKKYFLQG